MTDIIKAASYICHRYKETMGVDIDEMKLHKLLYFTQRESIIMTGEPMFDAAFSAWRYGPVAVDIRERFRAGTLNELPDKSVLAQYGAVFDSVFEKYACKDSWSLSILTHGEYSWQNARRGLLPDEKSSNLIAIEDIRKDAERMRVRRFLMA